MRRWLQNIKKSHAAQVFSVFIAVFLLGSLAGHVFPDSADAEKELGGPPAKKSDTAQIQDGFLYEKREILAYRPNAKNRVQVSGFLKKFPDLENSKSEGEGILLYSFIDDPLKRAANKQNLIPTAYITKNSDVFLSGVGDKNFVILDQFGDNIIEKFQFLKDHHPLGNFIRDSANNVYFTKQDNKLYKYSQNSKKTEVLVLLPINEGFYPKIEGFSSDNSALLVSKGGGYSFAELFRVNLSEKTFLPYEGLKGARNDQMAVCADKEQAVFIKHSLDPTKIPYGAPIPPSSLMLLDLQSDTATEITSSQNLFESLRVSCSSQKIAVKEKNKWRIIKFSGEPVRHKLESDEEITALSNDGKKTLVRKLKSFSPERYEIYLKVLKSGNTQWQAEDYAEINEDLHGIMPKIRYTVIGTVPITSKNQ